MAAARDHASSSTTDWTSELAAKDAELALLNEAWLLQVVAPSFPDSSMSKYTFDLVASCMRPQEICELWKRRMGFDISALAKRDSPVLVEASKHLLGKAGDDAIAHEDIEAVLAILTRGKYETAMQLIKPDSFFEETPKGRAIKCLTEQDIGDARLEVITAASSASEELMGAIGEALTCVLYTEDMTKCSLACGMMQGIVRAGGVGMAPDDATEPIVSAFGEIVKKEPDVMRQLIESMPPDKIAQMVKELCKFLAGHLEVAEKAAMIGEISLKLLA